MADEKASDSESKSKWENFAEQQEDVMEEESSIEQGTTSDEAVDYAERDQQENQITALKQAVKEHKESRLRMAAELQNVRERAARDVTKAHKFANEKLLNELLPVLDSLLRGLENAAGSDQAVLDGMQLTLDMFHKVLTQHGVEIISPSVGDTFNPDQHEAMSMQKTPDAEANTVLQVLQQGYSLNGRVIRAAMVIVVGA